jgi:hypothetical protein
MISGTDHRREPFWNQLLDVIARGAVVPVVGEDLLRMPGEAGRTMYEELAARFAETAGIVQAAARQSDLSSTVRCHPDFTSNPHDVYHKLGEELAVWQPPVPEPLRALARIRHFNLFVSTTFDNLLQRALDEERFAGQAKTEVIAYSPKHVPPNRRVAEQLASGRPVVFQLFGDYRTPLQFALTEDDRIEYIHALQSAEYCPKRMLSELYDRPLLPLGNRFPDWLMRIFLRMLCRTPLDQRKVPKHYFADSAVGADELLRSFLKNFATNTEVVEDLNTVDFVTELSRRWTERYGSEPVAAGAPQAGAIHADTKSERLVEHSGDRVAGLDDEEQPEPAEASSMTSAFDENVQFTVFQPKRIRPARWCDLVASAHLEEKRPGSNPEEPAPLEQARRNAKRILEDVEAGQVAERTEDSRQAIPRGGEITFLPEVDGVEFNPSQLQFLWQEDEHTVHFRMRAAPELDGKVARGRMSVFFGAILVADLTLRFAVSRAAEINEPKPPDAVTARPYRKIFASYSHKDDQIVEQFERYAEAFGDEYLRDVRRLRSGEQWNERLLQMIDEADVFQLFWSRNALDSPYVEQEWRHALRRGLVGFVRPVYWEEPFPERPPESPAPELRRLHFQRLTMFGRQATEEVNRAPAERQLAGSARESPASYAAPRNEVVLASSTREQSPAVSGSIEVSDRTFDGRPHMPMLDCHVCGGRGYWEETQTLRDLQPQKVQRDCFNCSGVGRIWHADPVASSMPRSKRGVRGPIGGPQPGSGVYNALALIGGIAGAVLYVDAGGSMLVGFLVGAVLGLLVIPVLNLFGFLTAMAIKLAFIAIMIVLVLAVLGALLGG